VTVAKKSSKPKAGAPKRKAPLSKPKAGAPKRKAPLSEAEKEERAEARKKARRKTNPKKHQLFKPGQSGNPNGRPQRDAEVAALAREYTAQAIEGLAKLAFGEIELVEDNKGVMIPTFVPTKAPAATIAQAIGMLLDRGHGRAPQTIKHEGLEDRLAKLSDQVIDANVIRLSVLNGLLTQEQAAALPAIEYDQTGRRRI